MTLLVSAHGTHRHLINLNNWHATPQPAEVEIEFASCDEVEMCDVNVMTNSLVMVQRTYPKYRVGNLPACRSNYK
jgi:hypothetical protein